MGTIVGNYGVIEVDGTAIAELKGFSIDETAGSIPDTAQGDVNETTKPGRKKVTGTIDCHYDPTDAGQVLLPVGAEVDLTLYPDTTAVGKPEITVTATILGRSFSHQFEAIDSRSYTWEAAGTLTEGVVT